jgi:hypothetical protein
MTDHEMDEEIDVLPPRDYTLKQRCWSGFIEGVARPCSVFAVGVMRDPLLMTVFFVLPAILFSIQVMMFAYVSIYFRTGLVLEYHNYMLTPGYLLLTWFLILIVGSAWTRRWVVMCNFVPNTVFVCVWIVLVHLRIVPCMSQYEYEIVVICSLLMWRTWVCHSPKDCKNQVLK